MGKLHHRFIFYFGIQSMLWHLSRFACGVSLNTVSRFCFNIFFTEVNEGKEEFVELLL